MSVTPNNWTASSHSKTDLIKLWLLIRRFLLVLRVSCRIVYISIHCMKKSWLICIWPKTFNSSGLFPPTYYAQQHCSPIQTVECLSLVLCCGRQHEMCVGVCFVAWLAWASSASSFFSPQRWKTWSRFCLERWNCQCSSVCSTNVSAAEYIQETKFEIYVKLKKWVNIFPSTVIVINTFFIQSFFKII